MSIFSCSSCQLRLTILWIQLLLSVRTIAGILMAERRLHSGFKWPKHTENKFTWCNYTNFSKHFSASSLNFRFRSFDCASYSKFVKLIGQFHEFLNLIFGVFSCLAQLWVVLDGLSFQSNLMTLNSLAATKCQQNKLHSIKE